MKSLSAMLALMPPADAKKLTESLSRRFTAAQVLAQNANAVANDQAPAADKAKSPRKAPAKVVKKAPRKAAPADAQAAAAPAAKTPPAATPPAPKVG